MPTSAASAGDVGEQLDEVDLDVAGVGPAAARRRRRCRAASGRAAWRRPAAERSANALRTPSTSSTRSGSRCRRRARGSPGAGRRTSGRRSDCVGPGLDLAGAPAGADRHRAQRVEQHGLADAAQAGEHQAALGPAARDPLEDDLERVELAVAAGQLGRPLTGAGGVRVAHRIHASDGIGESRRNRRSGYRRRWRVAPSDRPRPHGMRAVGRSIEDRRRVRRFRRSPRMCLTGGTLASDQHHVGQAQRPGVEIGIGTYLDRDPAGDLEHGIDEVEVRG